MFFKSCYVNVATVIIYTFTICSKKTHYYYSFIQETNLRDTKLFALTTQMSTLTIMRHNYLVKKENEAVKAHIPRHWDFKTKKPQYRRSENKKTAASRFGD